MFRGVITVAFLLGSSVSGIMHAPPGDEATTRVPAHASHFNGTRPERAATHMQGASFGVATASFPVSKAAGKRIRFRGYIKTEEVQSGYAGLWWRVDGPDGKPLGFDNMSARGAKGTGNWRQFEIELTVDPLATNINFGALLTGEGTAWFDDLKVEIDGKRFANGDLFDFGFEFESYPTLGFGFGGRGYQVGVTDRVQRTGMKSLRMMRIKGTEAALQPTH